MKTTTITFTTPETEEDMSKLAEARIENDELIKEIIHPFETPGFDIRQLSTILEKLSEKKLLDVSTLMATILTADKIIRRDFELVSALRGFADFVSKRKKEEQSEIKLKDLLDILKKL